MGSLWTILVPTLGERHALFQRMLKQLLPQVEATDGAVTILAWHNNGKPSLPEVRQRLVKDAKSEYVSFVDDDDILPGYFVAEVLRALESKPDYVGFQVQCYSDAHPTGIAYHSLRHGGWWNEVGRYYRDISHINPVRRDLALLADFAKTKKGKPEDRSWADQLRSQNALKNEVTIDQIMYHYMYSTARAKGVGSRAATPHRIRQETGRPVINSPAFSYHSGSTP